MYWRLDFDIEGAGRDVVERRGLAFPRRSPWAPIVRETARKRTPFDRGWRIRDADTGRGYRIVPGLADGTADAYGLADFWFLRYHADELDDGVAIVTAPPAQTQVKLGQYLDGESINRTDVVWYAGHFIHDEDAPAAHTGHIIGPELRPIGWS